MAGIPSINNNVPVAVTHDPLGRAMTEEQKARLQEQATPPVEETPPDERVVDRRREGSPREQQRHPGDDEDEGPGQIIDSYA